MNKFVDLAIHVVAMQDDAYLNGHPEWREIVKEAKNAIKNDARSYKIAIIKDLNESFEMGLLTTQEYWAKIKELG